MMASRLLKDGQIVFAGIGIPLLAATLAQRNFAPHLTILFEGGTIGPFIVPGELPPSTNEQRCTRRANMVLPITDVLLLLQRGYVDVGFMGGAQIDRFGNLNSSFIGDADNPKIRLPGTGGGNDISSLTNMIVAMKHEKRRFVDKVDFVTSPGWLEGRHTRERCRPAAGRHVARRHRPGDHGLRRGHARDEGAGPAPGRHARAGAGQHRLRAAVRRQRRNRRAAAPGRARRAAPPRPRAALHGVIIVPAPRFPSHGGEGPGEGRRMLQCWRMRLPLTPTLSPRESGR